MDFKNLKTNKGNLIDGILLIKPKIFRDDRGFFYESWNQVTFDEKVEPTIFCQDNHSKSEEGVLRGIHYQLSPYAQGKLVRCTKGKIFDIAIDLRKESNTFKEWIGVELNDLNKYLLWIPEGFGHGFLTLCQDTEVQYKVTKKWNKEFEKSLLWNDPDIDINWPLSQLNKKIPKTSIKDSQALTIKEAEELGFIF